jgi:ABC-type dipeptide/oligopeptide/nickel transport system permease component
MGKYIVRRVLQFIPVFLGVTIIMFLLQNVVPGDPIKLIAGDKAMSPETEMAIKAQHGLILTNDDGTPKLDENGEAIPTPLIQQYGTYLWNLLHGDLGTSYKRSLAVSDILAQKYPYTVRLAVVAIILEAVVGIGAGMISGHQEIFLLGHLRDAHHLDYGRHAGVLAGHAPPALLWCLDEAMDWWRVVHANLWCRWSQRRV